MVKKACTVVYINVVRSWPNLYVLWSFRRPKSVYTCGLLFCAEVEDSTSQVSTFPSLCFSEKIFCFFFCSGAALPVFWEKSWFPREMRVLDEVEGRWPELRWRGQVLKGMGSILTLKALQWWRLETKRLGSVCVPSEQPALSSSQNHLSGSCPSRPDPATLTVYCTICFPASPFGKCRFPMQIMFCKGQKIEAQGWIVTTKRRK